VIPKTNHKWKLIPDTLTEMLGKGGKAVKTSECPGNQYCLQGQAAGVSNLSSLINGRSAPQTLCLNTKKEEVPELPFHLKRLKFYR